MFEFCVIARDKMNLNWYQTFIQSLQDSTNNYWVKEFSYSLENTLSNPKHGHFPQWHQAYQNLPEACTEHYDFNANAIEIGQRDEIANSEEAQILHSLKELIPWRKGPFNLFGHFIDAEWRSDMKWSRIAPLIPSLQNKTILDVGCGNGYYMLRMLGAGAKQVIGVDPNLLYLSQFYALKKMLNGEIDAHLLPISFDDLPCELNYFDYVFTMGVLYHRRNPMEHLNRLAKHIKPNGALILETLIIGSQHSEELIPSDRYAGMRMSGAYRVHSESLSGLKVVVSLTAKCLIKTKPH